MVARGGIETPTRGFSAQLYRVLRARVGFAVYLRLHVDFWSCGDRALIDILVKDPEYLAEPFTAQLVLRYSPHLEMLRLDCDPEQAGGFTR